jgi:hypothetical protein
MSKLPATCAVCAYSHKWVRKDGEWGAAWECHNEDCSGRGWRDVYSAPFKLPKVPAWCPLRGGK